MNLSNRALLSTLLCFGLTACSGGSGSSGAAPGAPAPMGTLSLQITDAPLDLSLIEEACVTIDEIRLHRQADGESGFVEFYSGDPVEYDLTDLRNGVTRTLSRGLLETGTYRQIRLHMVDARVLLTDGTEFTTADGSLQLTSQDSSGYKIFLRHGVELKEGEERSIVVDFDLSKVFKPIPGNDLASAQRLLFRPNLRAAVREETGEVRALLQRAGQGQTLIPADGTHLHVLPPGETDPDQSVGTTFSELDGSAAFLGLEPGVYDLLAVRGEDEVRVDGLVITAGDVLDVELVLP